MATRRDDLHGDGLNCHRDRRENHGNQSVLSAPAGRIGTSLVGWMVLLALTILLIANVYFDGGTWLGTRIGSPQPTIGSENISRTQLGAGQRGAGQAPFDLSRATVPANEIMAGGPPKDGIPALTNPQMIAARDATYLAPNDRVIGLVHAQEARAYPLKILNYHEVVNDRIGDVPVVVTYCPLCDSAAAFDRRTELGVREFGVSGLLYNSNVLMYDRGGRPESLWSQVKAEGVSGPAAGKPLKALPVELTTWGDWRARYPHTTVLSPQTGHQRDYTRDPYAGYFQQPGLMFPARPMSDRLSTKERVLGIWTDTAARAYPISAFAGERRRIEDEIDGKKIVLEYNRRPAPCAWSKPTKASSGCTRCGLPGMRFTPRPLYSAAVSNHGRQPASQ